MNLVLDIGNTLTKAAWFKNGDITDTMNIQNSGIADVEMLLSFREVNHVILSSVNNINSYEIKDHFKKVVPFIILDHQTLLPIIVRYSTPETLGYDRIAAAVGAQVMFPGKNVLVIDTGTAITIDFISSGSEFTGGNISPGLQTRFRSLHEFTGRLPLVEKDTGYPEFGTSTNTAIAAGVQKGIEYELNGYIDDFRLKYPQCECIITGGDALFFVSKLKSPIFAEPELVLKGLNAILEFNIR